VEPETVTSVLGAVDLDVLEEVSQNIIERKTPEALALIEKVINQGKDLSQFISGLMEHFRNILVTKIVGSKNSRNLIELPQERLLCISEQGKGLSLEEIFYVFNVLVRVQEGLRKALSSRVLVEMGIIKLTQREKFSSLEEILSRLAALEQKLGKTKIPVENNPGPFQSEAEPEPVQLPSSGGLNENWRNLLEAIKEEKMFVATALEMGGPCGIKDKVLTIAFSEKHNFYKETLEHSEDKKLIEAKAKKIFGDDLKIKFILDKNLGVQTTQEKQRLPQVSKKASATPIIQSALKAFGGRIIKQDT
jgi:DNA polymerase-3 subunit gamma/tau